MQAVAIIAPGEVEVVDIPAPEIKEYEALVKVRACGFCNSTDLKTLYNELSEPVPFPIILGHEGTGEIIEIGKKVKSWQVGDRVLNPYTPVSEPFTRYWGNMAEFAIVQDREAMKKLGIPKTEFRGNPCRFPNSISFEEAAVILTLKEACGSLKNFDFQPQMDAMVVGDGPVGLALVKFLKLKGANHVVTVGHRDERLARFKKSGGADMVINSHHSDLIEATREQRFDLVIDAVGNMEVIKMATKILKPRGKICVYGLLKKEKSNLNLHELPNNTGIIMQTYPWCDYDVHSEVLNYIKQGGINPRDFFSHMVHMSDIKKAIHLTETRQAFKVVTTWQKD